MHVSLPDLLAIVAPLGALMSFMWFYFNKKFEGIDHKFKKVDEKIYNLRAKMKADIKKVEEKLGEKMMLYEAG